MSYELVRSGLRRETELLWMWLGGGLLLIVLWGMLIADQVNLLCAVVIAIPLLLLAVYDKQSAALWTLVYLILLGDVEGSAPQLRHPRHSILCF